MNDAQRESTNVLHTDKVSEEIVHRRKETKEETEEEEKGEPIVLGAWRQSNERKSVNHDSSEEGSRYEDMEMKLIRTQNILFSNTPIVKAENELEPMERRSVERTTETANVQPVLRNVVDLEHRSSEPIICTQNNSNSRNASLVESEPIVEEGIYNNNLSHSPTRDYYILTITNVRSSNSNGDVFANSGIQEELIDEEESRSIYVKPKFLTKLFGYKIKRDYGENNPNKKVRMVIFLFFLLFLFIIESYLLYHNASRLKTDTRFVLMESKWNNPFVSSFLHVFKKNELNKSLMNEQHIEEEIMINKNDTLYDRMCGVLLTLRIPCNYNDYYDNDGNNNDNNNDNNNKDPSNNEGKHSKESKVDSALKAFQKLKENDIIMYKIEERKSAKCNMISKRFFKKSNDPIFLFSKKNKDVALNFAFIFFTIFFLCIRILLMTSHFLFQCYILFAYRGYCMSLKSRKSYLFKYIGSISTIIVLEIILGPECVVWWIHNMEPRYIYHAQYFTWSITTACYVCHVISKMIQKYKRTSIVLNQPSLESEQYPYGMLEYVFRCIRSILLVMLMICTLTLVIPSIHKSTIIVAIVTVVTLLVDLLNNLYFRQFTYHIGAVELSDYNLSKKFSIVENKRTNEETELIKMHRVNEHMYRELSELELQPIQQIVVEHSNTQDGEENNHAMATEENNNQKTTKSKISKKEKKKCKCKEDSCFKSCIHKKEYKRSLSSMNPYETSNPKVEIIPEFCEICDERFRNIILFPCLHGGFCEDCIRSLISNALDSKNDLPHCPFCRNVIQHVYKITKIYNIDNKTTNTNNEQDGKEMIDNQIVDVHKIITIEIQ